MLLPYPFDSWVETVGRAVGFLTGWHPEGRRVKLVVTESGDSSLWGRVLRGRIAAVIEVSTTVGPQGRTIAVGPYVTVVLDEPLLFRDQATHSIVTVPRFWGHGPYRMLITCSEVNIHPIRGAARPSEIRWEDMIAICEMCRA